MFINDAYVVYILEVPACHASAHLLEMKTHKEKRFYQGISCIF